MITNIQKNNDQGGLPIVYMITGVFNVPFPGSSSHSTTKMRSPLLSVEYLLQPSFVPPVGQPSLGVTIIVTWPTS